MKKLGDYHRVYPRRGNPSDDETMQACLNRLLPAGEALSRAWRNIRTGWRMNPYKAGGQHSQ